jgi:hypothetical protein
MSCGHEQPGPLDQPPLAPSGQRLVFVGGLHRSGTSLVHRCLAEHPSASGFRNTGVWEDEGQHLQTVYLPAAAHGGPGRFGFDPEAHLTETSNLVSDESRDRLLAEWGPRWNPRAHVWVEKSPPNLIRGRFLQALFPDAVFVFVIRHPAAIAVAGQKLARSSYRSAIRHWVRCHEIAADDAAHLRRVDVIHYERFVADPDRELKRAFELIGLDPHRTAEPVRSGSDDTYFRRFRSSANPLRAVDRRLAVRESESCVARFGYSLVDLTRAPNAPCIRARM